MYQFTGRMLVMQPDSWHSFVAGDCGHPMLPPGPELYLLGLPLPGMLPGGVQGELESNAEAPLPWGLGSGIEGGLWEGGQHDGTALASATLSAAGPRKRVVNRCESWAELQSLWALKNFALCTQCELDAGHLGIIVFVFV